MEFNWTTIFIVLTADAHLRFGSPDRPSSGGLLTDLQSTSTRLLVLLPTPVTTEGTVFAFSAMINKNAQKFDFQIYRPLNSSLYRMISQLTVTPSVINQQEIVSRQLLSRLLKLPSLECGFQHMFHLILVLHVRLWSKRSVYCTITNILLLSLCMQRVLDASLSVCRR